MIYKRYIGITLTMVVTLSLTGYTIQTHIGKDKTASVKVQELTPNSTSHYQSAPSHVNTPFYRYVNDLMSPIKL